MLNEPSVNVDLENSMSRNLKGITNAATTQNGGESLYEDSKDEAVLDYQQNNNTNTQ